MILSLKFIAEKMSSTPDDTPVEAATVEPSVPSSKRKHEPIEDEELDGGNHLFFYFILQIIRNGYETAISK